MILRAAVLTPALIALAADLRIEVTDESGRPVWCRLEVHGPDGRMHVPESGAILSRRPGRPDTGSPYLRSFVVEGRTTLQLAEGNYRVVAERGLEFERLEKTVAVGPQGAVARLRPKRWIHMRTRGWWSGDMHVHRPLEDSPALVQAEDINLAAVFTMWNRVNLWSGQPFPADPMRRVDEHHWMTVANAEDERGGGAWMLHHLNAPLGIESVVAPNAPATQSWSPPGIEFVRKARAQRKPGSLFPWFDSEKLIWWEVPVLMAIERPDSIGLLNNHYNQYTMLANEAWGRPRDTAAFPDLRGFSDYSLSLVYRYWNLGLLVPPSAGSASGVLPNPVGYNRMYVRLDGGFSVEKWYAALRDRQVFVTNGPMLLFEPRVSGTRVEGSVEAIAREPIDRIEIVSNGKVVHAIPAAGERTQVRARFRLDLASHTWVAARCFLRTPGSTVRLAHTAPHAVGGRYDAAADAAYFTAWIDELIGASATPERSRLVALYQQARGFYQSRR